MKLGLYIHIPFCRQKCFYCDFPSSAGREHLYETYTAALCREIAGKGGLFSSCCADTVYIGGGTPTLLSDKQLYSITDALRRCWRLTENTEFSIEANPGTVDAAKLAFLHSLGINRISFGVQSFEDKLLKRLGRIHSAREAIETVYLAQVSGFSNLNVDLMCGLPDQTTADWERTLAAAAQLNIQHVSAYGLKIEEGTPFYELEAQGKLPLPDEVDDETMYDTAVGYLPSQGFERYEISNYAVPGYECRHNLKYWRYLPYLGMGASAHSFIEGRRCSNTPKVDDYIAEMQERSCPTVWDDPVEPSMAMAEYIFLALRTTEGVRFDHFKEYFKDDARRLFAREIAKLEQSGWLVVNQEQMFLSPLGMKFGNAAFMAFLPG